MNLKKNIYKIVVKVWKDESFRFKWVYHWIWLNFFSSSHQIVSALIDRIAPNLLVFIPSFPLNSPISWPPNVVQIEAEMFVSLVAYPTKWIWTFHHLHSPNLPSSSRQIGRSISSASCTDLTRWPSKEKEWRQKVPFPSLLSIDRPISGEEKLAKSE